MSALAENIWRTDDLRPVLAALRECGIRPDDPQFRGELRRLFDNAGIRVRFCKRSGLSVDAVGEMLWDRGFTVRRLTCVEILDVMEQLFTIRGRAPRKRARPRSERVVSAAVRRARDNRQKKILCSACGQILRGSRNASAICGICYEMRGEIVLMKRVDPTPEEILAGEAAAAAEFAA